MNKKDFEIWRGNTKQIINAQILLDRLKREKKTSRKQENEIKEKIKKLRCRNHIGSPAFERKPHLKRKVILSCLKDYNSFMSSSIYASLSKGR